MNSIVCTTATDFMIYPKDRAINHTINNHGNKFVTQTHMRAETQNDKRL